MPWAISLKKVQYIVDTRPGYTHLPTVDTRGESPSSFCNGLGTIYIASLQGRTIDLSTRLWDQSLGMLLGRC